MKKIMFIVLLLGIAPAYADDSALLKETVSVDGDAITFNDLLQVKIPQGDTAVFAAPAPGEQGVIQTSRVRDAAQAYGIVVHDSSGRREIKIERRARTFDAQAIKDIIAIAAARKYRTDAGNVELNFDNAVTPLNVETDSAGALQLSQLRIETLSGRFEARIIVAGSKFFGDASPYVVTGQAAEIIDVVKLNRSISRGEIITQNDMTSERMRRQQISGDALRHREDIVGLVARRTLNEDTILQESDLEKPKLVARNDSVLIVYETANVFVTVRGKAIGSGTRGDVIEVQNTQSKKSVQGTITGPGKVTVLAAPTRRVADISSVQN